MLLDVFLTLFLVALNGFFVAAEFAIVKVRYSQIELSAQKGNRLAGLAQNMLNHLDAYLSATQLGITLASLGLGWIGEPVVSKLLLSIFHAVGVELSPDLAHKIALPVAFALITVLHIVFGELAPKSIAIRKPEETTLAVSLPMRMFFFLFRPAIWVLNGFANFVLKGIGIAPVDEHEAHSADELRLLMKQSQKSGAIKEDNFQIIQKAFDFSELTAQQVMVPRKNIFALEVNTPKEKILEKLIESGYSRVPVYENDIDNILGIVFAKDIFRENIQRPDWQIRDLLRPVQYVYNSARLNRILKDFQTKRIHLSVVIDEYGGTEGLIALEDILEELVGEIRDEYDEETDPVVKNEDGSFTVSGIAPLHDLNNYLPYPFLENKQYNTLNGLVLNRFGRIPPNNEVLMIDKYEVVILERKQNILTLMKIRLVDDVPTQPT
ncbi:MAG: HlyC/CorC family transporter [Saprospiraceae bacterium]|nr:HlyC/CorC family transporter [Saprospiraceae bacterium]